MQFKRIRAVVLSAGLGGAGLGSGCFAEAFSSGGCDTNTFVREVPNDGRDCEAQCADITITSTTWTAGGSTVGDLGLDECELRRDIAWCKFEVELCGEGRPPAALRLIGDGRTPASLAGELARVAAVEASSVEPFLALADALGRAGAPLRLVRGARAAARDEVRHARAASAWSRRVGGAPAVSWTAPPTRWGDLAALALDNRVHGTVGETWGAVLLAAQAERTADAPLGRFYGAVARDEARHAALARAVDRWVVGRLDAGARRALDAAETQALDAIDDAVRRGGRSIDPRCGRPEGADLVRLWVAARAQLWS